MNLINLNTFLFAGKWALIGLVYIILIILVIAVRREMAYHTTGHVRPVAAAPGRLKVINTGSDKRLLPGKTFPLKPETQLGADPDNDLILSDQFISGHHARLYWDGAVWWVEDLGSSNGTTIDGLKCPPRNPRPIKSGASLQLGDSVFEFII